MYSLTVYVPAGHLEAVKEALFAAGAGAAAGYDRACWQVLGEGQFRPQPGSRPAVGCIGQETRLPEYRLELVCRDECLAAALDALRRVHPYEQPAYAVLRLEAV